MKASPSSLPGHDAIGRLTRTIEVCSLVAALMLLVANLAHVIQAGLVWHWWSPLGRRFLRPFRVHHVNPGDFLRRDFIDCNGDVAMLNIPILAAALVTPVATGIGATVSLGLATFAAVSLPTNQVHQWAHMPRPPAPVRWLQRHGILLSVDEHARHHREPYVTNYCIATGWCNRWLSALNFFPACEDLVTRLAGLEPRTDEKAFQHRW